MGPRVRRGVAGDEVGPAVSRDTAEEVLVLFPHLGILPRDGDPGRNFGDGFVDERGVEGGAVGAGGG
eukprot:915983-Rhodomonas_salina.2